MHEIKRERTISKENKQFDGQLFTCSLRRKAKMAEHKYQRGVLKAKKDDVDNRPLNYEFKRCLKSFLLYSILNLLENSNLNMCMSD